MRATLRRKYRKIYLALVLCCNEKKLKEEESIEEYEETLEPFIEQWDKINDCK